MIDTVASVLAALLAAQTPEPSVNPQPADQPIVTEDNTAEQQDRAKEGVQSPTERAAGASIVSDAAPEADPTAWDVNNPPLPRRPVTVDTDEGTWMNLDVSPDGRTLVFDLLGDIYTLPIAGGTPTRIAEGLAWEQLPRFSPDGARIAFTSDRGGGDNIWIMDRTGANKFALTDEDFRLLSQPAWSPDGRFVVARKHFTTQRSLGTGELWLYALAGGKGAALVERKSKELQKELGEPAYAPDGSAVYYTRNVTPGPIFEYAQDSNGDVFDIEKVDVASGEVSTVASGAGGSIRATPSPDGKRLAFARRVNGQSTLFVKDLTSGAERALPATLDRDLQETWAVHGVYPTMAWLPDNRTVVFWAGGHINRIDVDGGAGPTVIPFRVTDTRDVIDPIRPRIEVAPASFQTTMPRFATVSPDGRTVVYETLGHLWTKPVAGGEAKRLTRASDGAEELFPAWSRDGRQLAYVRWTDAELGQVRVIDMGSGRERTVSDQPGHYRRPAWAPDGRSLVVEAGKGGYITSPRWSERSGVLRMPTDGSGTVTRVATDGTGPHFGATTDRIYFTTAAEQGTQLVSVDANGKDQRVHAAGDLVTEYQVSPDGAALAFAEDYNAFVMPFVPAGSIKFGASAEASELPVTRVSDKAATYLGWTGNGQRLSWTFGPGLYAVDRARVFQRRAKDEKFAVPTAPLTSLSQTVRADVPTGTVAFTGAKIVTMNGPNGGVIENGTVVVQGNRILAVGDASTAIPAGARRVDATGKTILPGFIDGHAHGAQGDDDIVPQANWVEHAELAYGVTTIHDPSSKASEIFTASERQRVGDILAPRIFSSGEIVYGAKAPGVYAVINSLEDAQDHVDRLKAQGAHSIKNYNQPRRDQRQQVVVAAHRDNIITVAEGGSLYGMDITLIADGNTSLEHNIPQLPLYKDVVDFFGQTKVGNTPTLVVTYSGLAGDPYWRAHTDVFAEPILAAHAPPDHLAGSKRRTIAPESDYVDDDSAAQALKLRRAGVPISIGAHGQEEGLGAHWELWSFVRGGWSPMEALEAATIVPARAYGFDRDLGSLEAGKLADLVVIDGDPTADIRQSSRVSKVMLNGRLYDAMTLNEEVTGDRRRAPYFWE